MNKSKTSSLAYREDNTGIISMARKILAEEKVHSSIIDKLGGEPEGQQCIAEVEAALQQHQVLVVGMSQNPFPQ